MSTLSCCDLVEALLAPRELAAIAQCLYVKALAKDKHLLKGDGYRAFCYQSLKEVSRSFAAVVMQLNDEVRDAVCVFYLVLRALDTIEDDMAVPVEKKTEMVLAFHEKLNLPEYSLEGVGEGHEQLLLVHYTNVLKMYRDLRPEFQAVIKDICKRMGEGMVKFFTKKVETTEDYEEYCFYVAGLVGYGLTDMFVVEGCDPKMTLEYQKCMGLFLQKVNIIRDFLEDQTDKDGPRCWWPKEIYGKHADSLWDFVKPENREKAVDCLNDMVENALVHVPRCLQYLAGLDERSIFTFCAIPQVMALATLVEVYNNPKVFDGKVKMRKGAAARVMVSSTNITDTKALFREYLTILEGKAQSESLKEKIAELKPLCQ